MTMDREVLLLWGPPVGLLLIGLLVGMGVKFILQINLLKLTHRTSWEGDDLIVKILARRIPLLGVLIGAVIALPLMPISEALHSLLGRVIEIAMILAVTWIISGIGGGLIGLTPWSKGGTASTSIFKVLLQITVWIGGITIGLERMGVAIAPIVTALGVGGIAVALALQDTLSNLFAGIQILMSNQIKIGDYVKLDSGEEGYIADINWRNTTLKPFGNNIIMIPNKMLSATVVTNYNLPISELTVRISVGVSYGSDLEDVERVTLETASEVMRDVPGGVPDFEPVLLYGEFSDSSINFRVILRAQEFSNKFLITHEFIKRLHARYKQENIEIPFPQRVVTMHEGQ